MPRCQECKTVVPAQELPALASAGGWDCPCGERIRVRPANEVAALMVPGARWLVNEGATGGGGGGEPENASEPVMFACMACGGGLRIDGSARTIDCQFCGGSNYLPDGLWLRLHPHKTVRTFFVVAELDDAGASVDGAVVLPEELLVQLARADDSDVRKAAAAQPALPVECFERLVVDDDYEVRAAIAANRRAPQAILDRLATDDDDDVLQALARNPATSQATILRLLHVSDSDVRRAAVRSGRADEGALLELAKGERNSGVLEVIAEQPLTPALLAELAGKRGDKLQRLVARHPDTPAAALIKLSQRGDRTVLKTLASRPPGVGTALPKPILLALAEHDDDNIARLIRARPDYIEVAAQQRARRMLIAGISLAILAAVAGLAWATT